MPEHPTVLQPPDDHRRVRPETPGIVQDHLFGAEIGGHDLGFFFLREGPADGKIVRLLFFFQAGPA